MTKKQELIDYVIGNEFITKPSLQNKFTRLLDETITEQCATPNSKDGFSLEEVDKSKLTHIGSMNYILQIFSEKGFDKVQVDQYQPRKNRVWTGEMTREEVEPQVEETIERMKIAITHLQEYLEGERETVYYWELENE